MTEDTESIAKRLVVGQKRDGRSIYDRQARSALVRASRQSGVSLARIARVTLYQFFEPLGNRVVMSRGVV